MRVMLGYNRRAWHLATLFLDGVPGGIRTPDTKFRKLVLYPTELRAHGV